MKRGQVWSDAEQILTNAKVPAKDIEKMKNEFENRRHTTKGRSTGINVKDEYGNVTVIKSYSGQKITFRKGKDKEVLTGNDTMKDAVRKMRMVGIHPVKIQDFLQHYASKDHYDQVDVRNLMDEIARMEIHRTKITSKSGMSEAVLAGDVIRVGRRNPGTGRWEYESFHKDNTREYQLRPYMGKDTEKVWKKWKDIQAKISLRETL
jgi:hypothetical protein